MTGSRAAALVGIFLALSVSPAIAGHDKSDIVTLDDGSTLIGEIKTVKFATLSLHTNAFSTISIEWRHITGMQSKFEYRVESAGEETYFGSLGEPETAGNLAIVSSSGTTEVPLGEIVLIVPIEHGFLKRIDGSVNFGLSYTQANSTLQYNLSADATYRTRKLFSTLSAQSIFNRQNEAATTNQNYLDLAVLQMMRSNWSPFEIGQVQRNPDQGYDLRTVLGGGAAHSFIKSAHRMFLLNLGGVYNREEVTGSTDVNDSAEALVGVVYRRFKRGSHSPDVLISLSTFTSATGDRRFRALFNFNLSWKIVGDLKFNFQVRDNYDSSPPEEGANKSDVSIVTSVGYTF